MIVRNSATIKAVADAARELFVRFWCVPRRFGSFRQILVSFQKVSVSFGKFWVGSFGWVLISFGRSWQHWPFRALPTWDRKTWQTTSSTNINGAKFHCQRQSITIYQLEFRAITIYHDCSLPIATMIDHSLSLIAFVDHHMDFMCGGCSCEKEHLSRCFKNLSQNKSRNLRNREI